MKLKYFVLIFFGVFFSLVSVSKSNYSEKTIRDYSQLNGEIKWYARDSVVKIDNGQIISLFGDAKLECSRFAIIADEIVYNTKKKELSAKNYSIIYKLSNKKERGKFAVFPIELEKE